MEKEKTLHTITAEELKKRIQIHLKYSLCKQESEANREHLFTALALAVRDFCVDGMFKTAARHSKKDPKRVYYLSVEYLIGRLLENNLHSFGIYHLLDEIKLNNDIPLKSVLDAEYDPALGNGGLGRLAACFMDSMATLGLPGYGYGINYQFGLFRQQFENGYQKESADSWLDRSSPWQIERGDRLCKILLHGHIEYKEKNGMRVPHWVDCDEIYGIPYDMPIVGFEGKSVNYIRLYSAKASSNLDFGIFNEGNYLDAVDKKIEVETISKVLYPSDSSEKGRYLRLMQQYFFVACSISDILRRFEEDHTDFHKLPEKAVIQMNDTHPTLAIVELMRILIDEKNLPFDEAWEITTKTMAYTNHTLLPEALEKWPVAMFEKLLPRHLMIIYDINDWLMKEVQDKYPGDFGKMSRMSLIEEGLSKQIRMANLAIAGSFSVNGVAKLHTNLIETKLVPDFYQMTPEKFNNKTNGITQRRWLLDCNMPLANLISSRIGDKWITDLNHLHQLEAFLEDEDFMTSLSQIKLKNKEILRDFISQKTGILVDTHSIFDVQAKRIHEYKRQLLNALHIILEYLQIVEDGIDLPYPKTYIFAGKAAPGYEMAKLIVKFINNVAKVINNDERTKGQIKVVFIPDYKVSVAEKIFPASEVSEQISTAGFEASGTGNMKFMLNGALTIGTLDGANIEIREEVGGENFYLFGLNAEEIARCQKEGTHRPWDYYNMDERIKRVMDAVSSNRFCPNEPGIFQPIFQHIMFNDYYMTLADFASYLEVHHELTKNYLNQKEWNKKSLINIARSGKFSSDRTICEYARDIWHVQSTLDEEK
ncbi:MAG: glycogen/starch/alpha-glucan phosphorylase [Alphaproteobacteria bacterium]|nr:glycogen/starch/alpha-glucan phosphorylase [Alphaproteobacteria bacterium]